MEQYKPELRFVHPNELHDYWGLVLPGLEKVRGNAADGWLPEDVYHSLKSNASTLHVGEIDGDYCGFIVLTPIQGFSAKRLHVWCLYTTSRAAIDVFLPEIRRMAKQISARQITFHSPRKGWERRLAKLGFSPAQTIYAMEV